MNRKAFIASLPFLPSAVKAALAHKPKPAPSAPHPDALTWANLSAFYDELMAISKQQEMEWVEKGFVMRLSSNPIRYNTQLAPYHNGQA